MVVLHGFAQDWDFVDVGLFLHEGVAVAFDGRLDPKDHFLEIVTFQLHQLFRDALAYCLNLLHLACIHALA